MFHRTNTYHLRELVTAALITYVGLLVFKFIPMSIFGRDILFDASGHIAIAMFVLYALWFFIDQNKSWHTPYYIFCAVVLCIISFQRLLDQEHNDVGLLLGFLLGAIAIGSAEWPRIRKNISY